MYHSPAIPSLAPEEVDKIARELNFNISKDEIPVYQGLVNGLISKNYSVLEKYVEPALPVKYPRTPGYRPSQGENPHNAWYYKTDIPGAASGPLHGMKVAIKDMIPVAGVPMMNGSRIMEGYVPDFDPPVVTRILDAGATISGKATCDNLCYSAAGFTSHPAPVLNPHDPSRNSGGSSSGCAVLVQTGEVDMALGTDLGGSVRLPACWTGVVGLKPTFGLVPCTGVPSMCPAFDHIGPMAADVRRCALMLEVIAGDDGMDPRQRNIPKSDKIPKYSSLLSADISGRQIGLLTEAFDGCDEEVASIIRKTTDELRHKGAVVEEVSIPIHTDSMELYCPALLQGAYHTMIQSQGAPVGPPGYYPTSLIDNIFKAFKSHPAEIHEHLKIVGILGKYMEDNYGMRWYAKSNNLIRLMREKYDEALQKYDVLVFPTIKHTATKIPGADSTLPERLASALGDILSNTSMFNGTGHPVLSLPVGMAAGLPVGMSILGKHLDEQTVLNIARACELIYEAEKP